MRGYHSQVKWAVGLKRPAPGLGPCGAGLRGFESHPPHQRIRRAHSDIETEEAIRNGMLETIAALAKIILVESQCRTFSSHALWGYMEPTFSGACFSEKKELIPASSRLATGKSDGCNCKPTRVEW